MFALGDVVYLHSGSMPMTVGGVSGNKIQVTWARDGEIKMNAFPSECLTSDPFPLARPKGDPVPPFRARLAWLFLGRRT